LLSIFDAGETMFRPLQPAVRSCAGWLSNACPWVGQAKDIRAAVGSRYGDILPAEGHLFDLLEPEDVVPAWKRWSPILLRPEGLYGTRPAKGGNKAAKAQSHSSGVALGETGPAS
jgi:hypothetical protein